MVRKTLKYTLKILLLVMLNQVGLASANDLPVVRVGVLNFGTVNWELEAIKSQALDHKNKINIEITPLGSKNATHVAIQGGAVDIIVTDWLWVSRQRDQGRGYTFVPYSRSTGSLIVKADSNINSLEDFSDLKLGVAGGPYDKSWIFLSAYMQKRLQRPLKTLVDVDFAAPPLINKLFTRGEFDAVLNYWHYAARLESQGHKVLVRINEILPELGVKRPLPMIGWVFNDRWANKHPELITQFLKTSAQAKTLLLENDDIWLNVKKLMKVSDETMFETLKLAFRQGIPDCFDKQDLDSLSKAYLLLAQYGDDTLIGDAPALSPGTIWENAIQDQCD